MFIRQKYSGKSQRQLLPWQMIMTMVAILFIPACANPATAPADDTDTGSTVAGLDAGVLPGVAFLPPLGVPTTVSGLFDPDLELSVAVFQLGEGPAAGQLAGPAVHMRTGNVVIDGDATELYEAHWHPDSGLVSDGAVLRLEVQLPHASDGIPVCASGPALVAGCVAFVDIQLTEDGAYVGRTEADAELVPLANGALPVRIHVEQGAVPVQRVHLGHEPVTVPLGNGASIEFPAMEPGREAVVDVALLTQNPVEKLALIDWESDTIWLRYDGAFVWPESSSLRLRLPVFEFCLC